MSPHDAKCADRAAEPDPAPDARTLADRLDDAGVSRRRFLTFCAAMVATLALPERFAPRVAAALSQVNSPVVVWLEFQDCAGDTEAFLRSRNPSTADLLLGLISLNYHETVMAAAGRAAEKARDDAVARGGHLVIVEGSVPTGIPGACTIGGRSAEDLLRDATRGAAGIINVGTCSAFGGIPAAGPNPTGAVRVEDIVDRRSGGQPVGLPGERRQPDRHDRALPDLRRVPGHRQPRPPAVRLRAAHPRQLPAPRPLRRRPVRGGVGRRGTPQGLVPLPPRLQGTEHVPQLPERGLQRRHVVADRRRPRLRRVFRAGLLGRQ